MARGRPWSEEENTAIKRATFENAEHGILDFRPHPRDRARERGDYARRLERLAAEFGRTCAAVRKRAERIGARSYPSRERENSS